MKNPSIKKSKFSSDSLKEYDSIHNDISLFVIVIPGLTRNPVFFWIPAFAGMTCLVENYVVVYILSGSMRPAFTIYATLSHKYGQVQQKLTEEFIKQSNVTMKQQVDSYDLSAMLRKSETLPRKSKITQTEPTK